MSDDMKDEIANQIYNSVGDGNVLSLRGAERIADGILDTLRSRALMPEAALMREIVHELSRARAKFPGPNVTMLALMEEVGELAQATFEKPRAEVRKEAVQVAVMAMRVILDGDATLDAWREGKGLDPLVEGKS